MRKKKVKIFLKKWSAVLIAAFFAILFLMPIILTITNSFMASSEISSNYGQVFASGSTGGKTYISEKVNLKFIPDMVSFSQYITVLLKSPDYLFKFWNSVILVAPIVFFQLMVAVLASYGFTRYRGRIKEIIFFTYIILMLMPYQVTLVPNYLVSSWLHLLDTRWAIWLPGIFSPFAVYLLTKFMRRIPISVIEAAQIDGASSLKIFWFIVVKMSATTILVVFLFSFVWNWNETYITGTLLRGNIELLPSKLNMFNSEFSSLVSAQGGAFRLNKAYKMAATLISISPLLLLYVFVQKQFIQGIENTGITGE